MNEMDEYLRMAFMQIMCDEWKAMCSKALQGKNLEETFRAYEEYELKIYNLTNYIRLHINGKNKED